MKKQFSLLLAALLLSTPLLASCASDSPDTPSTDTAAADTQPADTTAETTRENYPDSLPALDFGGENMNIHVRGDAGCIDEVFVEELTGEVVNDAVFERMSDMCPWRNRIAHQPPKLRVVGSNPVGHAQQEF